MSDRIASPIKPKPVPDFKRLHEQFDQKLKSKTKKPSIELGRQSSSPPMNI